MSQFSAFCFVLVVPLVACQRPIYNIGTVVFKGSQIDEWLNQYGTNALEADVKFNPEDGTPNRFTPSRFPCDLGPSCFQSADIASYVNFLKERTKPSSPKLNRNLVLTMFDCKLSSVNRNVLRQAGEKFVDHFIVPLYQDNPTKMKVIISVPNFTLKDFISGVLSRLRSRQASTEEKIGFEISEDSDVNTPQQKEAEFKRLGVAPGHAWLSAGISSWNQPMRPTWNEAKLRSQVQYRDNGSYFSKVYTWTVDKTSSSKWYLNLDLDGIITNYPRNMNAAIAQFNAERSAGNKIRLATLDDNPFEVYQISRKKKIADE